MGAAFRAIGLSLAGAPGESEDDAHGNHHFYRPFSRGISIAEEPVG